MLELQSAATRIKRRLLVTTIGSFSLVFIFLIIDLKALGSDDTLAGFKRNIIWFALASGVLTLNYLYVRLSSRYLSARFPETNIKTVRLAYAANFLEIILLPYAMSLLSNLPVVLVMPLQHMFAADAGLIITLVLFGRFVWLVIWGITRQEQAYELVRVDKNAELLASQRTKVKTNWFFILAMVVMLVLFLSSSSARSFPIYSATALGSYAVLCSTLCMLFWSIRSYWILVEQVRQRPFNSYLRLIAVVIGVGFSLGVLLFLRVRTSPLQEIANFGAGNQGYLMAWSPDQHKLASILEVETETDSFYPAKEFDLAIADLNDGSTKNLGPVHAALVPSADTTDTSPKDILIKDLIYWSAGNQMVNLISTDGQIYRWDSGNLANRQMC